MGRRKGGGMRGGLGRESVWELAGGRANVAGSAEF